MSNKKPVKLEMSVDELCMRYRESKTPLKMIGILADMNCCQRFEIAQILVECGYEVPKQYRMKVAEPEAPEGADGAPEATETDATTEAPESHTGVIGLTGEQIGICINSITAEVFRLNCEIQDKKEMLDKLADEMVRLRTEISSAEAGKEQRLELIEILSGGNKVSVETENG